MERFQAAKDFDGAFRSTSESSNSGLVLTPISSPVLSLGPPSRAPSPTVSDIEELEWRASQSQPTPRQYNSPHDRMLHQQLELLQVKDELARSKLAYVASEALYLRTSQQLEVSENQCGKIEEMLKVSKAQSNRWRKLCEESELILKQQAEDKVSQDRLISQLYHMLYEELPDYMANPPSTSVRSANAVKAVNDAPVASTLIGNAVEAMQCMTSKLAALESAGGEPRLKLELVAMLQQSMHSVQGMIAKQASQQASETTEGGSPNVISKSSSSPEPARPLSADESDNKTKEPFVDRLESTAARQQVSASDSTHSRNHQKPVWAQRARRVSLSQGRVAEAHAGGDLS